MQIFARNILAWAKIRMTARYIGEPHVKFLADGRDVKLLKEFAFRDEEGTIWAVPAGAVVDGASIPKAFWSIIGGPFEGKYRDPSIIHDWYCDTRQRTWQATHRVFYEAMIVSTVPSRTAKLLYLAVRLGGPRWDARVSINTNLLADLQFRDSLKWRMDRRYDGSDTRLLHEYLVKQSNSGVINRYTAEDGTTIIRYRSSKKGYQETITGPGSYWQPRPINQDDIERLADKVNLDEATLEEIDSIVDAISH